MLVEGYSNHPMYFVCVCVCVCYYLISETICTIFYYPDDLSLDGTGGQNYKDF